MMLAGALYPLLVVLPKLIGWATGEPIYYLGHTAAPGPMLTEPFEPGVVGRYSDEVVWQIADATIGQRLASLLPAVFTTALLVAGCLIGTRLRDDLDGLV